MTNKRKRRQKYRVIQAEEYLAGLHPHQFAALLTALDNLDDSDAAKVVITDEPPREPTTWERIKSFLFGSKEEVMH